MEELFFMIYFFEGDSFEIQKASENAKEKVWTVLKKNRTVLQIS